MRQQGGIQEHETYPVSTHEEYVEVAGSNGSMCLMRQRKIDGSRKQEWQWVMHLCCVQIQSSIRKEVHGMAGICAGVRDARMLVQLVFLLWQPNFASPDQSPASAWTW